MNSLLHGVGRYPGDMGGHALADVLFGSVSPAGRSSQTWCVSVAIMR